MSIESEIVGVYQRLRDDPLVNAYHQRHGVESMLILSVNDESTAVKEARSLFDEIVGKRVVEIGAGVGLLAVEMARVAKSVIAIEADPG